MQPKKGFNHFFNKDVVFSTVFVFLGVLLLKYSVVHLHALDPIEKALSDFDYNDLVFKHRSENTLPAESNVVVVELGKTRAEIAREIAEKVKTNATIDWTIRESARAKLMVLIRRTLKKYNYPPQYEQKAIDTVIKQAELMANFWTNNT